MLNVLKHRGRTDYATILIQNARYSGRRDLSSLPLTIRQVLATPVDSPSFKEPGVHVHGWIKSIRKQKRHAFADIRDGTTHMSLQAVLDPDMARSLTAGMSVALKGPLELTPKAAQPFEIQVKELEILGECDPELYPIQKKTHTNEYLRDHVHLRPRTGTTATMLRLRDHVSQSFHSFYKAHGFVHVHTPLLTSSDCEGAGEVLRVKPDAEVPQEPAPTLANASLPPSEPSEFFSKPAYLTVSSQLHLEALATSLSRVYTISPAFRAERSQTNRHLSEFWMLEAELAFCNNLDSLMDVVEHSLKHVLRDVSRPIGAGGMEEELLVLDSLRHTKAPHTPPSMPPWVSMVDNPWKRMTYSEAIDALKDAKPAGGGGFNIPAPKWGESLQSEHERWLADIHTKGPVFVTDYPTNLKPFYMRLNDDPQLTTSPSSATSGTTVACFDLLIPGLGELVGGSLREERLQHLERAMDAHGLSRSEYSWYLDLRRYGTVPHGGFGVGFERFISWVSGLENIRECIAFPRWAGRMAG